MNRNFILVSFFTLNKLLHTYWPPVKIDKRFEDFLDAHACMFAIIFFPF